jgi:hypothetical protein
MIARFDQQTLSQHHVRDSAKMILGRAVQIFAMGLVIMEWIGCSSIVAPPPAPQSAHIGIALSSRTLIQLKLFEQKITAIYFVRLEEDQNGFISKFPPIPSNAKSGNRFYLLNAQPGRYVAVAALKPPVVGGNAGGTGSVGYVNSTPGSYVVFSKPLVALTEVKAEPGRLVFMGNFLVKAYVRLSEPDPDEVQLDTIFHKPSESPSYNLGSVKNVAQGADPERQFLKDANDDLGESGWGAIIQEAIKSLGKR